jgi:hypothetical protein
LNGRIFFEIDPSQTYYKVTIEVPRLKKFWCCFPTNGQLYFLCLHKQYHQSMLLTLLSIWVRVIQLK